jgi:hypothetical protein
MQARRQRVYPLFGFASRCRLQTAVKSADAVSRRQTALTANGQRTAADAPSRCRSARGTPLDLSRTGGAARPPWNGASMTVWGTARAAKSWGNDL